MAFVVVPLFEVVLVFRESSLLGRFLQLQRIINRRFILKLVNQDGRVLVRIRLDDLFVLALFEDTKRRWWRRIIGRYRVGFLFLFELLKKIRRDGDSSGTRLLFGAILNSHGWLHDDWRSFFGRFRFEHSQPIRVLNLLLEPRFDFVFLTSDFLDVSRVETGIHLFAKLLFV